jgi:hypothetical protein
VTWAEIEATAKEMREWLKFKTTTGGLSAGLVYQLARHYCRMPQLFGERVLLVDIHAVLGQIGGMEKVPLRVRRPPSPPNRLRQVP